jgi:hypothetical protein
MWTINDFQAYKIISGWSMHGKLACSYCMENSKTFILTDSSKISFFLLPPAVLANGSQVQKEHKGLLSGEELYDVVSEYGDIVFGFQSSKHKFHDFDLTHI